MSRGWYHYQVSVTVIKSDGTKESFDVSKLKHSLKRAGATSKEINEVVYKIDEVLHEGIQTQEIYRLAFEFLRQSDAPIRARYALRRALFGLGPTGFPFEDFLARLFAAEGYTTKTRVMLQGACAPHELDVAAYKKDHAFVAEAKFHSRPGIKSDLQVVMYSFARLHDLKNVKICSDDICGIENLLVVTNTKFTSTAERYAECAGVALLSWNYPRGNNLHDRIQKAKLYPITVLQTLSNTQKQALISRGAIVSGDIIAKPHLLRYAHISKQKIENVLAEAKGLSG